MTDLLIIFGLLLALSFFSSAETALTAVSKPLLHQMELDGDRRAALVNRLLDQGDRLLGSILLGNTVVQILASSLTASLAVAWYGETGVVYAAAVLTVLVLVFCEIIPKTVVLYNANRLALFLAPAMRVVAIVLGTPMVGVQAGIKGFLRFLGVKVAAEADSEESRAELLGAIDIHTAEEEVRHEGKMLRSILDLADVTVGEVMTHRKNLATIDADQPAVDIVKQITASQYSRLPLWRDTPENIVGVLHSKALLGALQDNDGAIDAVDVCSLTAPPWFIPESTSLLDQLQAFRTRHEHFALVVDEYGALLGVVTLEDIIEEIVGDISDEHDEAEAEAHVQSDGSVVVGGDATLRDLNRQYDWRLPDIDATTIAGLVMHESRMIPEQGQVFLFYGFRFEIIERVRNHIAQIRVTPPAFEDDSG